MGGYFIFDTCQGTKVIQGKSSIKEILKSSGLD